MSTLWKVINCIMLSHFLWKRVICLVEMNLSISFVLCFFPFWTLHISISWGQGLDLINRFNTIFVSAYATLNTIHLSSNKRSSCTSIRYCSSHASAEVLLKLALNTNKSNNQSINQSYPLNCITQYINFYYTM